MSTLKPANRMLPAMLVDARRRQGISQKQMAIQAEVDQSNLCALEKGRGAPSGQLVDRLATALELNTQEKELLHRAALHDTIIQSLSEHSTSQHIDLVSTSIKATWTLAPSELAGAVDYLRHLIESRAALDEASRRGRSTKREESAMP